MRCTLFLALGLAIGGGAAFAAQKPIGFERWEAPGPIGSGSGVDFGLKPKDIYKDYAAQFLIGLPETSPLQAQKDKRLIDIEVRTKGDGLADYVWDIVWVSNEGDFKLDSWFIHGLKADEVMLLAELDDVIILDIERYPKGLLQWQYAVILQRNSGKFAWSVLLGADPVDAANALHSDFRVVDVDRHQACPRRHPREGACPTVLDVVMVQNTGTNFIDAFDLFEAFPPVTVADYQLRDLDPQGVNHMTSWISPGSDYQTSWWFTKAEVEHSHLHTGRIIDLEIIEEPIDPSQPGLGTTIKWWTVNLTQQ